MQSVVLGTCLVVGAGPVAPGPWRRCVATDTVWREVGIHRSIKGCLSFGFGRLDNSTARDNDPPVFVVLCAHFCVAHSRR